MTRLANCLAISLLILGVITLSAGRLRAEDKPIKADKDWNGTFSDIADFPLMKEAPGGGYITNPDDLARLWKAWRGKEAPPNVDFTKELVFVHTALGPNVITMEFQLDDRGNLTTRFVATERGGLGFVYKVVTLKREGIKTINGRAIATVTWSEARVREHATAFANEALKGKTFRDAADKEFAFPRIAPSNWIYAEIKEDRWRLGINPPAGVTVVVSFKLDGSDPKLEQATFAPN